MSVAEAVAVLRSARSVVVFTGAGVSAESGLPTYRGGADALWSHADFERYANPAGYAAHLPDSYHWYRVRAELAHTVAPNPAHVAIAALERAVPECTVVTQNIDSLHQRAGSQRVIELHGHLRTVRCARCGWRCDWAEAPAEPSCGACRGMLRPEVVMFTEMLPEDAFAEAVRAAESCDVLISVGTSAQVWPAAEIPLWTLRGVGRVVIVNPDLDGQPDGPRVTRLRGPAGEIMPRLVDSAGLSGARTAGS